MGGGKLIFTVFGWLALVFGAMLFMHGCSSDIWDNQNYMTTNITIVQTNINTNSTITIVIN